MSSPADLHDSNTHCTRDRSYDITRLQFRTSGNGFFTKLVISFASYNFPFLSFHPMRAATPLIVIEDLPGRARKTALAKAFVERLAGWTQTSAFAQSVIEMLSFRAAYPTLSQFFVEGVIRRTRMPACSHSIIETLAINAFLPALPQTFIHQLSLRAFWNTLAQFLVKSLIPLAKRPASSKFAIICFAFGTVISFIRGCQQKCPNELYIEATPPGTI